MKYLSRQEELLLLSIWKLKENAYGVTIRDHISKATEKAWSIGATYDILDRLTRKALVTTIIGDPIKSRGGKSRRFYRITKKGFKALVEVKILQKQTWADLPDPVFK
jgi:PadR family transcriptional regulator PadR